jgi:hypothetical protein
MEAADPTHSTNSLTVVTPVLVQPEASCRPNSRERSSELASDKLYQNQ